MRTDSLTSFSKISREMERLSLLMSQEEKFKDELKHALANGSPSLSDDEETSQLDLIFQEYNNPTTKSLPFDQEDNSLPQENSQTIGTIYRNYPIDLSQEVDKDNNPDDKSTVILAALRNAEKTDKNIEDSAPNYSSAQQQRPSKKQSSRPKKSVKNATTSMPSEGSGKEHYKSQNNLTKNNSNIKGKFESPVMGLAKKKQGHYESQDKDLRQKFTKISKIDREELSKLQEKKTHKKSELSSNRKKTKRGVNVAKSISNLAKNISNLGKNSSNLPKNKTGLSLKHANNVSKGESTKKEVLLNHQDWQRLQKQHRKLNRVNIVKLQENMKKAYDRKPREVSIKKNKKGGKFESYHRDPKDLKLHFTEGDEDGPMKKLIQEKELTRQYSRETGKYLGATARMSKSYFQELIKHCREPTQEAVLRIKLLTLVIYFFDQFTQQSLLSCQFGARAEQFFNQVPEEEIIQVLLHPKKVIKVMEALPSILMNDNVLSVERTQLFLDKFGQVNDQLDQELEFFLIKKETLYCFIHTLSEYLSFLIQRELVLQTKRTKLATAKEPLHGFYSGRSKREGISKGLKKSETNQKLGFRCDSDRKITVEDEDFCPKEPLKSKKEQKQLKKLFK